MWKQISRFGVPIVLVVAAVVALAYCSRELNEQNEGNKLTVEPIKQRFASLKPGRVVELSTAKGAIEFVLFEEDAPDTTRRIADLVSAGDYNGVKFRRVERNGLIQTARAKTKVAGMPCEVPEEMRFAKGAVGMARLDGNTSSNTSEFFILLEPRPDLNHEYTNFGRLIRGMDVAMKIRAGDAINTARLRPLTKADEKRLSYVLTLESKRRAD